MFLIWVVVLVDMKRILFYGEWELRWGPCPRVGVRLPVVPGKCITPRWGLNVPTMIVFFQF